jgi:hypothetical protein
MWKTLITFFLLGGATFCSGDLSYRQWSDRKQLLETACHNRLRAVEGVQDDIMPLFSWIKGDPLQP